MTPKQTLILWRLLGQQGQARQSDIAPKLEKKDREALVAAGLASIEKIGRTIYLKLEDKGWRWAGEHLSDELPNNYRVLQQWLAMLHRHLDKSGETLADFIGPAPDWPPAAAAKPKSKPARRKPTSTNLRARIERAYLSITGGEKDQPAPLSRLRAALADVDRATLDAALLRILQSDEKARLGQISDPKAISADERAAAFDPGGEPYHLIWIQS